MPFSRKGSRPATEGFRDGAGVTQLESVSPIHPTPSPCCFRHHVVLEALTGLAFSRPQFPHFKVERITTQLTATNTHNRLWKEV